MGNVEGRLQLHDKQGLLQPKTTLIDDAGTLQKYLSLQYSMVLDVVLIEVPLLQVDS